MRRAMSIEHQIALPRGKRLQTESPSLSLWFRQKVDGINLPATYGMRNGNVNLSASCGIIDPRMEIAVRFKELGLKHDVTLYVNGAHRRPKLLYSRHKILLR
jgi:hypothetical protein